MKTYDLEFSIDRIACDNFKAKQVSALQTIIAGGRLMWDMEFSSFANISFDKEDIKHRFPKVTEQDAFNRVRTNCLVYNLHKTQINPGKYDKCFIYQTNGVKTNGFMGFVFYNSETGKCRHKFYVNRNEGDLCIALSYTFNIMRFQKRYLPYEF